MASAAAEKRSKVYPGSEPMQKSEWLNQLSEGVS